MVASNEKHLNESNQKYRDIYFKIYVVLSFRRAIVHMTKIPGPPLLRNVLSDHWNIKSISDVEHWGNLRILTP